MNGDDWRIRWAVTAVDEGDQPVMPYGDDGEPLPMAIGLTADNRPVIEMDGRVAYLPRPVALVASAGLRTVIEQALRRAGEL
ncbi:hypothetical protein [Amycolatopsis thermoflava]|uniref:hypothetical protein n=1 Tax=Amycolatopsis thermoflava TaxID=84480 RepID=UPI003F49FC18